LGTPRALIERLTRWPAYAIRIHVEETFLQTPGPGAGARLQGGAQAFRMV